MKIEFCGDHIYVYDFWDCECEENFTHRKSEVKKCPACKVRHDESSDSRLNEMLIHNPNMMTEQERELAVVALLMASPRNFKDYAQRVLDDSEKKLKVWCGKEEFEGVESYRLELK